MSSQADKNEPLLSVGGNYRKLFTFQKAEAVFDITSYFCNKYLLAWRSHHRPNDPGSPIGKIYSTLFIKLIFGQKAKKMHFHFAN